MEALTWSADNRTGHLPQETQPYGTLLSQGPASARFGGAGGAYGVINNHLSPGINHKVQSESVTARRPVDDDLDSIGKYFFIYFYGYGALLHYDLERHIWYDFERQLGSHRRQAHTADRHCTVGLVQLADDPSSHWYSFVKINYKRYSSSMQKFKTP